MPETITRLKVFVSSPSNLDSHRATVNKVLEDLSHDFGQDRGIEFRVFNWERDAVPGISSDPQAVISGQLEYDIYIGLLGTVFGSPTPRAGSGTEEEFLEAYGKYLRDSTSVRVLFYFEKISNEVFQIDLAQLGKVQEFRRKLGPQGVLYHDFSGLDALRDHVRSHIRALVRNDWLGSAWKPDSTRANSSPPDEPATFNAEPFEVNENIDEFPGSDELGMMELVIEGVAASKQLSDHLERVTKSSNEFGEATSSYNEDTPPDIISNPEALKARFDAYSQTMREYKNLIQPEISIFRAITENILSSIGQLMDLVIKEKAMTPEDIESLITQFALLLKSIKTARDLLQDFRQILDRAPSITMEFRSAKKHLIRVLDEFIASYTIFIGAGETLTSETRRLI